MCGIAGFFSRNGKKTEKGVAESMTECLRHRGPDGAGIYVDHYFTLGHRRLSIIDIAGGAQPMTNEDGSVVVVFNGEIYNYKELREELLSRGHRFHSASDTEVIVHLYEEKGMDMFAHLNGMFAIAIADKMQRKLVLGRDRLGKKPLYYYADKDWIIFASELKAIVLHPAVLRELDNIALYDYLSLNYIPGMRTMLKDISRVPPGTILSFTQDKLQQFVYWEIAAPYAAVRTHLTETEALEEFDSLLSDSVRVRLRSDVPLGIFLSGGIDSSLIASKAVELGADICGYTASFSDQSFSEEKYAREIALLLGIDLKVFEINPDVEKIFETLVYHGDDPCADSSSLPVYLLSQNTSKSVKVVLGGDGGDELFAGYLTYQATLLARQVSEYLPTSITRALHHLAMMLPISEKKVSFEYKVKRFMRGLHLSPGLAHFSWNGTWCSWEKERLLTNDFLRSIAPPRETYEEIAKAYGVDRLKPELRNLQLADICEYLPNDILAKVDRMSMAHGLEVRSPLLDHRIVAWSLTLPSNLKLRRKCGKYLLKRYMSRKFPSHLVNRSKQGFSIPINKWIREPLWPMIEEFLSEEMLKETGIFHAENVRLMLDAHKERKASFGFEIWGLLVFMVWHKMLLNKNFNDMRSYTCLNQV